MFGPASGWALADIYEPDNHLGEAGIVFVDALERRQHTLHSSNDEDWLQFYANAGTPYEVHTTHTGSDIDVELSLYDAQGVLQHSSVNHAAGGGDETLAWAPAVSGTYYVKVRDTLPPVLACRAEVQYEIGIVRSSVGQTRQIQGRVLDIASGEPVPDVTVCDATNCVTTDAQGAYQIAVALPALGSATVTLSAGAALTGEQIYQVLTYANVPVSQAQVTEQDFALSRKTQIPPFPAFGRLINISTRAHVGGGADDIFAGFILSGSGRRQVMLRGIAVDDGTDPALTLLKYNGSAWEAVAFNDDWRSGPDADAVRALPTHLQLPDTYGNDSGLLYDLETGAYSVQLTSNGAPGLEVVGVDAVGTAQAALVNLSTRAHVGGGAQDAFAGFALVGAGSRWVMLRGIAVDPGVDPVVTLLRHNGSGWEPLASNDAWQDHPNAAAVGLLPKHLQLPDTYGNDAGMLMQLKAGVYSAQLSSNGAPGQAVIGVDAVDPVQLHP